MGINECSTEVRVGLHDTADKLDHTISNTAKGPDGENLQRSVSLERGSRCRVTTYGIRIPVTIMNLIVRGVRPDLSTWKRLEFMDLQCWDEKPLPVAASMINKSAVMTEKKRMAVARTVRVGQRLIKGAMRIAPTHWAAWLTPWAAPTG